jgi:hypothetical protein
MLRRSKLIGVCAALLLLVCLPALADTKDSFSNESLTGNSGSTVSGSFTFTGNASGGTFSNLSLVFNSGAFNGIKAIDVSGGQAFCALGLCTFSWAEQVGKGWVWDTIILNVKTGQYWDTGNIYNLQNQWNFDPPMAAPEGGTQVSYLLLSGLAMVVGILISRKRRTIRTAQSH